MHRRGSNRRRHLPDWLQVVENPHGAAVCADNEIVSLHHEVVHRNRRQVQLQRPPRLPVIDGIHHAALGCEVEHASLRGVFPDGVQIDILCESGVEPVPGASIIGCLEQIGTHVVESMGVDHDVGGASVERRRLDHADRAPLGEPCIAAVTFSSSSRHPGDVHEAVVASRPDQALLLRRLGDRKDGAVGLHAGVVAGDWSAGPFLFRAIVPREIGADGVPRLSAVVVRNTTCAP